MSKLLRLGSHGENVVTLTKRLNENGFSITPTNRFTPEVEAVVIAFQRANGLVVDGLAGRKTCAALSRKQNDTKLLTHSDLVAAANTLEVPLAAVMAVNQVESRGRGFLKDGRPVILFERHIMRRRMRRHRIEANMIGLAERHWPNLVNPKPGGYKGDKAEHKRLKRAISIHPESALESCSWGQFQIMGFHWQSLGYSSIDHFVDCMSQNEAEQLKAFVTFIVKKPRLHRALKALNWPQFARYYNGPAYTKNRYYIKLADAYARFKAIHG